MAWMHLGAISRHEAFKVFEVFEVSEVSEVCVVSVVCEPYAPGSLGLGSLPPPLGFGVLVFWKRLKWL